MRPVRLPVSGTIVFLRPLTGFDELLMLETPREAGRDGELLLAIALADRVAVADDGTPLSGWRDRTVIELDTVLLRLRQAQVGDRVRGEVTCLAPGCGERVQISFGIEAFLDHAARQAVSAPPADPAGWFTVPRDADAIRFRLPSPRDLIDAARVAEPEKMLARRCIHPPTATAAQRRRAERAMEGLAPLGVRDLQGICPACDTVVTAHFDIRPFCLRELRELASFLYDDVDVLARNYHWSEASILGLSSNRRARYAERARDAARAAA